MNPSKKIYLQTDVCRVTEDEVVIEGHVYALNTVGSAKVVSQSAHQRTTIPFVLALGFVVWMLSELVNGTDDYIYAALAAVLAVISMVAVKLAGGGRKHAAWFTLAQGPMAVFQSSDATAVANLVKAVNQAKASHGSRYAEAWNVGKTVNG